MTWDRCGYPGGLPAPFFYPVRINPDPVTCFHGRCARTYLPVMANSQKLPDPKCEPDSVWLVYLLKCNDGTLYCGMSNNLDSRIAAHNAGKGARYTRGRGPVSLVWAMTAESRGAALSLEAVVKKMCRREKDELILRFNTSKA